MLDLEQPLSHRTKMYRFFEMVPALLSYGLFVTMLLLSIFAPLLAAIFLLALIITMVTKALGIAAHSIAGYRSMSRANKIDWHARLLELEDPVMSYRQFVGNKERSSYDYQVHGENLRLMAADPGDFPKPSQLYHAVIIAAYNEPYEVIAPALEKVAKSTADLKKIIIVFAYEARGGVQIRETVQKLQQEYKSTFGAFLLVEHPAGLPDEIVGKGPNITYAAKELEQWIVQRGVDYNNVIITTLDCDNKPHEAYFDYLAYEYIVHENRKHLSFQPISLYFNNIWDAPAAMRIIATGNSFWTIVSSMRPHTLRNFAAHSQPMEALAEMGYWSRRSIVEDGHQYWRSYFYFGGNYDVVPIYVPIYQDAVLGSSFKATAVAQFKQLRRWAYGASDVPYVATHLFTKKRNVPFFPTFARFIRLLDSHVSLATIAILVMVGGWIPLLLSSGADTNIAAHNLPELVSYIQRVAMLGLFVTIFLGLRMLPPRPARYRRRRSVAMVLQWLLLPVVAVGYNAFCSLNAQTRLLFGRYLTTFDVTEKSTKESQSTK